MGYGFEERSCEQIVYLSCYMGLNIMAKDIGARLRIFVFRIMELLILN